MKHNSEKRACQRHCYAADIAFSYFNKEHSYDAHTLNIGTGGMCFKPSLFLQPGATVYIRLKKIHPNVSGTAFCGELRSVTLAEVKWCCELSGEEASHYGVGVKYFEPAYWLNANQQAKLKDLISNHGAENGDLSVNDWVSFKQIPDT